MSPKITTPSRGHQHLTVASAPILAHTYKSKEPGDEQFPVLARQQSVPRRSNLELPLQHGPLELPLVRLLVAALEGCSIQRFILSLGYRLQWVAHIRNLYVYGTQRDVCCKGKKKSKSAIRSALERSIRAVEHYSEGKKTGTGMLAQYRSRSSPRSPCLPDSLIQFSTSPRCLCFLSLGLQLFSPSLRYFYCFAETTGTATAQEVACSIHGNMWGEKAHLPHSTTV